MIDSIAVDPDALAVLMGELTDVADQLIADGVALNGLDRPMLGGSGPATDLADALKVNTTSMAASVGACAGAVRGLARVGRLAEVAYRSTEQGVATRWSVLALAFDDAIGG
jgi:hypothetical protein